MGRKCLVTCAKDGGRYVIPDICLSIGWFVCHQDCTKSYRWIWL